MRWITGTLVLLGFGLVGLLAVFVVTVVGFITSAFLLGVKVLTALGVVVTLALYGTPRVSDNQGRKDP